jgi:hypothetical protein
VGLSPGADDDHEDARKPLRQAIHGVKRGENV